MKNWYLFSLIGLVFTLNACHSVKKNSVDNSSFYLLEDTTLTLSATGALEKFREGKGVLQNTHSFNPGFTTSYFWLLVNVDTTNQHTAFLQIGVPHINKLEFYGVIDNRPIKELETGDHTSYSTRIIPSLDFALRLKPIYTQYLVKIDKQNESLQLTFQLKPIADFWDTLNKETLLAGILTGAIVLMILFGLYLAVITGEKIYFFYVIYIASGWLWVLVNLGYGFKYFWPNSFWIASRARILAALLAVIFGIQFIHYYAGIARYLWQRIMLRATHYVCWLLLALFLFPTSVVSSNKVGYVLQAFVPALAIVYMVTILSILIQKSFEKNKMAIFYLFAIGLWILFSTIQLLHYSGGVDVSGTVLEKFGTAMGYVVEVVVLTFGLAYRFNSYRYERIQMLIKMNLQQTKYAQTIITAQNNERRQLADQLHDVAGSLLSAAKLNLSSVREKELIVDAEANQKLTRAEEAVTSIADMLRNLSHAISPVMLDKVGFRKSVERVAEIFNTPGKLQVELVIFGFEVEHINMREKYSILYGILYELMNNIVKHAQAKNALIQLIEHDDSISMIVEDNGKGLATNDIEHNASHGLATIQSKIHYLHGSLMFDSAHPHGLILTIEIPKEKD